MSKNKVISTTVLDPDEIIRVQNLSFRYGTKTGNQAYVLKDFSFSFKRNLIYCICGSSGSGKSTLVSHFNGLLKSKIGNIWVKDIFIDPKKKKIRNFKKLRRYVSMVFQFPEYQLFKNTVENDIMFGPIALGIDKKKAKQNAEINLNKLGLSSYFLNYSPFELSGGQKRRVAIAGVLAIDSDVIIFDEPTAGLDPQGENEMIDMILNEKKNGKTIIMISHHMEHVLKVADCVLILKDGQLIASGEPYSIFVNEDLLSSAGLYKPYVMKIIDCFIKEDPKFAYLYSRKPTDIYSLAKAIKELI